MRQCGRQSPPRQAEVTGKDDTGKKYPGDCALTEGLLEMARGRRDDAERGYVWKNCLPRAAKIKLLLLDVDGVLTDGSITYNHEGREIKTFNTRDGMGISLLRQAGVKVGVITARQSEAVARRAQDLKLDHVYQGKRDKLASYREILAAEQLADEETAYMGDDWLDLPLLTKVGLAATVADADGEVKKIAHFIAKKDGGKGAVREVCDLIIEAKGMREALLARHLSGGDEVREVLPG